MLAGQADTATEPTSDPSELLRDVAFALEQGRVPRASRHLQQAARELTQRSDVLGAAEALRLAALLELRRGKPEQALRPIRAAERLVRDAVALDEQTPILDLLARILSHLGEHPPAIRVAERWAAGSAASRFAATRRLALAQWAAGEIATAVRLLDSIASSAGAEAGHSRLLLFQMLLQVGCPTPVLASTTRLLKGTLPELLEYEAHLARGWAALCLGQAALSLRAFRQAARKAAELASPRKELEAAVAVTFAERERAKSRGEDLSRAQGRVERRLAQAGRAGLEHLATPALRHIPQSALGASTPKVAAQCLVSLSRASENLAFVDACLAEAERLTRVGAGAPPYAFTQLPSLSQE